MEKTKELLKKAGLIKHPYPTRKHIDDLSTFFTRCYYSKIPCNECRHNYACPIYSVLMYERGKK